MRHSPIDWYDLVCLQLKRAAYATAVLFVELAVFLAELAVLFIEPAEFLAFAALLVVDGDLTYLSAIVTVFTINL